MLFPGYFSFNCLFYFPLFELCNIKILFIPNLVLFFSSSSSMLPDLFPSPSSLLPPAIPEKGSS